MRAFILGPGRCGTLTIAEAFRHATNYTVGHESRWHLQPADRWNYPDQHIEVDNRLCWMTGTLHRRYPDATYAHLVRDPEANADSLARVLWPRGTRASRGKLMSGIQGILGRTARADSEAIDYARNHVELTNDNARLLLETHDGITIHIENPHAAFTALWEQLDCEGDLDAALAELDVRHHHDHARTPEWARKARSR